MTLSLPFAGRLLAAVCLLGAFCVLAGPEATIACLSIGALGMAAGTNGGTGGMTPAQVQQLAGPLLNQVRTQVAELVRPVAEQQAALRQRLDDLSKPVAQASRLFGGAPGIRVGEDPLSSRGFSFLRLAGYVQGVLAPEHCKHEIHVGQRLRDEFERHGFSPVSAQRVVIPLGSRHLTNQVADGLVTEIRQSMRAGVEGADIDELRHVRQHLGDGTTRQALSSLDDAAGAALLGATQHGDMIELIRSREVFSRAGAREITLPPNGSLKFPRQTGASQAYWIGEGREIPESEPDTGFLTMRARKLAVLLKSPNELIRFGSPSVEAFFRSDMARSLALQADLSMLEAEGTTNRIKGLLRYAIQTHVAGTVGSDGDVLEPGDVSAMLAKLEEADHDGGFTFIMRPVMLHQISDRRAAAIASGDEEGPFLIQINRSDIARGLPLRLRGANVVTSTQISKAREKGDADNLTYVVAGDFSQWIIGRLGVAEMAVSTQGDTAFASDQTWLRLIQHLDAVPRHENAFVLCDNLLTEL